MESISLSKKDQRLLSTSQTSIIKHVMGFPKRYHHSALLQALDIPSFKENLDLACRRLYHSLMLSNTPAGILQTKLLSRYLTSGHLTKDTLLHRLVKSGHDPCKLIAGPGPKVRTPINSDGVVDSLRYLVFHQNFIKPWSEEYLTAGLILKAF